MTISPRRKFVAVETIGSEKRLVQTPSTGAGCNRFGLKGGNCLKNARDAPKKEARQSPGLLSGEAGGGNRNAAFDQELPDVSRARTEPC